MRPNDGSILLVRSARSHNTLQSPNRTARRLEMAAGFSRETRPTRILLIQVLVTWAARNGDALLGAHVGEYARWDNRWRSAQRCRF